MYKIQNIFDLLVSVTQQYIILQSKSSELNLDKGNRFNVDPRSNNFKVHCLL